FHNKIISELRRDRGLQPLPEDDLQGQEVPLEGAASGRWHEEFRLAAGEWLQTLKKEEVLLLGLRLRYRLTQRQVADLLKKHEGNISRAIDKLRERCHEQIGQHLREQGWGGDDLEEFIHKEMDSLILDDPRFSADALAALLRERGLEPPNAA